MANYADITNVTNTWQLVAAVSENVIWTPTEGPIFIYPSNTHPDTVGTNGLLLQPYESFTIAGGTPVYYKGAAGNEFCISRIAADHQALPGYDPFNDMMKVQSTQKKWRDSFVGTIAEDWDLVTSGGMTATLDAGVLTIATGTTAGAYAELLSKETFTIPFRAMFGLQTGATRYSNQHLYVEAVSVDPVTGLPDGQNMMAWDVGGQATTTLTQGVYEVQNSGLRPFVSAANNITSTTTYSILELEPFADEAYFHSRAIDSTNARSNSYVRHQQIPNPNALYKLRIRALHTSAWLNITGAANNAGIALTVAAHGYTTGDQVWVECLNGVTNAGNPVRGLYTITVIDTNTIRLNGTTFGGAYVNGSGRVSRAAAPASGSNFQFQFASCTDYAELTAEITAGRGQTSTGQSLGVYVTAAAAIPNADNIWYSESTTAQAANATVTGSAREIGAATAVNHRYTAYNAFAVSDQAGTLRIEGSIDGTTWRRMTLDTAVAANTPVILSIPVMTRYHRVVYVNGTTAQGSFMLTSSYTAG